jgi:hypothetical protein
MPSRRRTSGSLLEGRQFLAAPTAVLCFGQVRTNCLIGGMRANIRNVALSRSESRTDAEHHRTQTGEPVSDESLRARELLTGQGGYIFPGARVTGLTWAYGLSGGNLRAVQVIAGHTSPTMALRYQRAEMDGLTSRRRRKRSKMIESGTRT